ncbi:MAG: hypothetical protein HN368_21715, partial [Spirochaetales bacterium]|nr:hypothetical protein [Spirochaetales bacterium]
MLKTLKRHLRVNLFYTKLSLIRFVEYPVYLQNIFLTNLINAITGFFVIRMMFSSFQGINGWGVPHISFLYSFNLMTHGIVLVLAQPIWYMGRLILRGYFDLLLIRPLNTLFLHVSRGINYMDIANPICAAIMMAYSLGELNFTASPANVTILILLVFLCSMIRASLYLITSTTCFWWRNRESLKGLLATLMSGVGTYPLTVYPSVIRFIFTCIVPVGFVAFYPASMFLGIDNGFFLQQNIPIILIVLTVV